MYKVLSATPSPYARKVRILLAEKGVPFDLVTEVPWNDDTTTGHHNPLEKVPVLILPNGQAVYESRFICEWIAAHHPDPPLEPSDPLDRLAVRQFEVLADGICDALILMFFENSRGDGRSAAWFDRQLRKVDGGLRALDAMISDGDWAWGDGFSMADISTGSVLAYIAMRWPDHPWRRRHPRLSALSDRLETRPSFAATRPTPQRIVAQVV